MPAGRPTALRPVLTPDERAALEAWGEVCRQDELRRLWLVLLVADGWTIRAAAREVGLSRVKAYEWLQRFAAQGLQGLRSRGRGRPAGG
jgi:predicted ArsR family transcriptional regulator